MTGRIVVKLSGKPIEDPASCAALWATLARVPSVVVVHGGGRAVDARLADLGLSSERSGGRRVTTEEQIGVIAGVLAGEVNRTLVGSLTACGSSCVGVGISDAGLCVCEAIPGLGRVGRVVGGDPSMVLQLLDAGITPVVHSIGMDRAGVSLNVNADDAAAGLAGVIGAATLVLLTDVPSVRDAAGQAVGRIDLEGAQALIDEGAAQDGMIPKLEAAAAFARTGGEAVIGSWKDARALLAGDPDLGTRVVMRRRAGAMTG